MIPGWLSQSLMPYAEVRRNRRTLRELLLEHLSPRALDGLRSTSMVLLRPDALIDNTGANLLDYLEDNLAIVPVRLRLVALSPWLFDALYRFKMAAFGDSVWLHHRLFDGNPGAFVLVVGSPSGPSALAERLDGLKGPSSPAAAGDGASIRATFRRASSFHSVIHTPEDVGAFIYESTLVFSWQTIREVLEVAAEVSARGSPPAGIPRRCRRILLATGSPAAESVFTALLGIKQRILAAVWMLVDDADRPLVDELWELTERLELRTTQSYGDQRAAFLDFARAERGPLDTLIAVQERRLPASILDAVRRRESQAASRPHWGSLDEASAPLRLLYASWYLSGHEEYRDGGDELFHVLAQNGVPVPAWQRTLVQAGLRNDANPSAWWGGLRQFPLD